MARTPTPPPSSWALNREVYTDAIVGIADDYMTSEVHHPGYVLIPAERFEKLDPLPGARA